MWVGGCVCVSGCVCEYVCVGVGVDGCVCLYQVCMHELHVHVSEIVDTYVHMYLCMYVYTHVCM